MGSGHFRLALSERGDILPNATLRYCGCEARVRGSDIGRELGGRREGETEEGVEGNGGRLKEEKGRKWDM